LDELKTWKSFCKFVGGLGMSYSEHGLTVGCVWARCRPINLSLSNRANKLYGTQVTVMP